MNVYLTSQRVVYNICQAIDKGSCDENLSKKNPGKIVHSRWLTTANRILRLYVATENASENLQTLLKFILIVYAPMWFTIKTKPSCMYGANHLFKTILISRYLPGPLKSIIDPVIQRNGFFGHPENIILAMLADDRQHIKTLALRKLLKALAQPSATVRTFKLIYLQLELIWFQLKIYQTRRC